MKLQTQTLPLDAFLAALGVAIAFPVSLIVSFAAFAVTGTVAVFMEDYPLVFGPAWDPYRIMPVALGRRVGRPGKPG